MKAVSNALMALLLVAALFWGNCFSCPQLLLAQKTDTSKHGCCHRTKTVPPDCRTQVFRAFDKADPVAPPAVLPVIAVVHEPLALALAWEDAAPIVTDHAPPDSLFQLRI